MHSEAARHVLSVAELTLQVKELLETGFRSLWVSGEISNFSRPQSGHCYLTLKDERAQIRAVLWRTAAERLRFELEDGLAVVCQGCLEVYAPRGTYQLVIRHIEPKGIGGLELALRKLRDKLAAEGLFDPRRKRSLPRFPRRIAFVTSPTGAAIRDFLEVLKRRWRGVDVLVVPTRVQGQGAAAEIAAAVRLVNSMAERVDVLVVGRGGGSLEDLWAFNEEAVVRAVHGSGIPVVSAVGHEIDVTLCDLAADVRALTPSEAAERVAPQVIEVAAALRGHHQRLLTALSRRAELLRSRLDGLARRRGLARPMERIHNLERLLDEHSVRMGRAAKQRLAEARRRADSGALRLESLSPLAVLGRGYSLTLRASDQQVIRDSGQLSAGEMIESRFGRGSVRSRVI